MEFEQLMRAPADSVFLIPRRYAEGHNQVHGRPSTLHRNGGRRAYRWPKPEFSITFLAKGSS